VFLSCLGTRQRKKKKKKMKSNFCKKTKYKIDGHDGEFNYMGRAGACRYFSKKLIFLDKKNWKRVTIHSNDKDQINEHQ